LAIRLQRQIGEPRTKVRGFQSADFRPRLAWQCPRQESNLVHDLRGVGCDPAHPKDMIASIPARTRTGTGDLGDPRAVRYTTRMSQEPTAGVAPASSDLRDRRLSTSSHVGMSNSDPGWTRTTALSHVKGTS